MVRYFQAADDRPVINPKAFPERHIKTLLLNRAQNIHLSLWLKGKQRLFCWCWGSSLIFYTGYRHLMLIILLMFLILVSTGIFFFFLLQVWVIEMVAQISQVMENACEYVRGNTCVFTENSADPARSNQKCTRTFCISTYFLDHFDSSLMGSLLLSSQEIPFPVLKAHWARD